MATPINLLAQPGYATQQWLAGQNSGQPASISWGNGLNPADLAMLGWDVTPGPGLGQYGGAFSPLQTSNDGSMGGADFIPSNLGATGYDPRFQQFLAQRGDTSRVGVGESGYAQQFFGPDGQPIGQGYKSGTSADGDPFALGMLFAGGIAGSAAAGAAGAAGGAGGAEGGLGAGGGLSSADTAALYGPGGYGEGMTGSGAFDAAGGAAPGSFDVAYQPYTGPGSEGFNVAGDNAVAPEGWGSDPSGGLSSADRAALYGDTGYGAAASPAELAAGAGGGGFFSGVGDALGSAGSWIKSNPQLFGAGVGLVNGVLGAGAAVHAGNVQAGAANNALQAQLAQNAQTRADMAPWRAAGATALSTIGDLMGTSGNTSAPNYGSFTHQFNADDLKTNLAPNYQFMLDQGLGATQNAANAAGFSGNTLKGVNDYAQGYASNGYQQAFNNYTANQTNIFNRLSNIAGLGQTANQATGQLGFANTNAAGGFGTSAGAALAAGTVGGTNAITNALSGASGWNYLNSLSPGGQQYTWSDRRLKTDISKVGELDSGLPVYTYRYKAGGGIHMGVMAQDVEKVAPRAVKKFGGVRAVNYTLLKDI